MQQHTHQLSAERSSQQVVENLTSNEEAVGQDTTAASELTTDHTGARGAPEVTTAGVQQHTHQLSAERSSQQVVENLTSNEETVGQDTTAASELTTDHTGARGAPEVTTAGVQQHTHQLSAERSSQQVVENLTSNEEAVGQDTTAASELTTDHTGARSAPEVTTAGVQQHTHQLSAERSSQQVVENCRTQPQQWSRVNQQRRGCRSRHHSSIRAYNRPHRSARRT